MDRHAWNDRYGEAELVWSATPNAFVERELADLPPGRAIDLAAGEGRNAIWLAQQGWTVTALDFSDVAIDKAGRLADANGVEIELVIADLDDYEPQPYAYDLVLIAYLQVPEPSRTRIFGRAAGAVGPGGTFLTIGHDRSNLDGGYGGPQAPDVLATADEIVAIVAGPTTGLALDSAGVVERTVDTDEGQRTALDHLVQAHRPSL